MLCVNPKNNLMIISRWATMVRPIRRDQRVSPSARGETHHRQTESEREADKKQEAFEQCKLCTYSHLFIANNIIKLVTPNTPRSPRNKILLCCENVSSSRCWTRPCCNFVRITPRMHAHMLAPVYWRSFHPSDDDESPDPLRKKWRKSKPNSQFNSFTGSSRICNSVTGENDRGAAPVDDLNRMISSWRRF